jgi:hypothetical protein
VVEGPVVAAGHGSAVGTAFSVAFLVVVCAWALLFAVLIGMYLAVTIARRRKRPAAAAAPADAGRAGAGLEELQVADPRFDLQLLLDASRTAVMLVFAALSTGDDAPIRRVAAGSFWNTRFGRIVHETARTRRHEEIEQQRNLAVLGKRTPPRYIPLDFQASAPELAAIAVGASHEITIRIRYSQLQAVTQPGAAAFAAGAAAKGPGSGLAALGKSVSERAEGAGPEVSWLSGGGHYDLTFVRPGTARTDPSVPLAGRTCATCGGRYGSELATECAYCHAPRPALWGAWQLAQVLPVAG